MNSLNKKNIWLPLRYLLHLLRYKAESNWDIKLDCFEEHNKLATGINEGVGARVRRQLAEEALFFGPVVNLLNLLGDLLQLCIIWPWWHLTVS